MRCQYSSLWSVPYVGIAVPLNLNQGIHDASKQPVLQHHKGWIDGKIFVCHATGVSKAVGRSVAKLVNTLIVVMSALATVVVWFQ